MERTIRCIVADDYAVVREGMRTFFDTVDDIDVIGDCEDAEGAVLMALRDHPDVALLDVRFAEGIDGIEAARRIGTVAPEVRTLLFTGHAERTLLTRGREAGVAGYLLKEAPREMVLRAIREVAAGRDFVDPALAPHIAASERGTLLTAREREILQLLAQGMSNADAAERLFISQETVKSHVRHILAKLEADTRTQAVAIALREAIIV